MTSRVLHRLRSLIKDDDIGLKSKLNTIGSIIDHWSQNEEDNSSDLLKDKIEQIEQILYDHNLTNEEKLENITKLV